MKRITLNKTWRLCLSMWRWIAKQKKEYSNLDVTCLKKQWLREHDFERDSVQSDCFFCEHDNKYCRNCPGRKVDQCFDCQTYDYNYYRKPIAFYNKLRSLNRKRLAKK